MSLLDILVHYTVTDVVGCSVKCIDDILEILHSMRQVEQLTDTTISEI
jgi:hypothetical protein